MNKIYPTHTEAKEMICEIGKKMYLRGFVSANDGNITIRVGDNALWATPTGVSKGDLTPEMLILIDLQGNVLQGNLTPTSETNMHLRAYWENNALVSTCHAHALYSMIFATAGIELDMAFSPEPTEVVGKVPVAPYATPGTKELADSIQPFVKHYKTCLLANHGALAWGTTPLEAWHRMEALEAYCQLCYHQKFVVKKARTLSEQQIESLFLHHENSGITTHNRFEGIKEPTNEDPAIKLSQLGNSTYAFSDNELNVLADKIAQRILQKL